MNLILDTLKALQTQYKCDIIHLSTEAFREPFIKGSKELTFIGRTSDLEKRQGPQGLFFSFENALPRELIAFSKSSVDHSWRGRIMSGQCG